MKTRSTIFLQVVIILVGFAVLFLLIRMPLLEGRAKNLSLFDIYADPFIIYTYLSSSTFFVALYKLFKLLGYIRQNKVFSTASVNTLKSIKYLVFTLGIFIAIAGIYIRVFHDKNDDPAGFLAICIAAIFICIVVVNTVSILEAILQKGLSIQSNDEQVTQRLKK